MTRKRFNQTHARRRAQGLCGGCGGDPDPGMATCSTCRSYTKAWQNKRLEKRRLAKQCQRCATTKNVRLRDGRSKKINPKRKRHYICAKCEAYQTAAVKRSYLKHRAKYVRDPKKPYEPYGRRTRS